MSSRIAVQVDEDRERGRGHAVITVTGTDLPTADLRFHIRRAGAQTESLAPAGWQVADCLLTPDRVEAAADRLCLFVGPAVVRWTENAAYQFGLIGDGLAEPLVAGLAWRNVAPPLDDGAAAQGRRRFHAGGMAGTDEAPAPVITRTRTEPPAPPPPPAEPEPSAPVITARPVFAAGAPPISSTDTEERETTPRRRSALPALAAILALAAAGGAGWWWLAVPSPQPQQVQEQPPTPAPAPAPIKPVLTTDSARQSLQAGLSPEESFALAAKYAATPDGQEGAMLLYLDAADRGHAGAAAAVGRLYDPTETGPTPAGKRRADRAVKWYRKAREAGDTDAAARLTALRAWAEQEAAKGNAEARALLAEGL